MAVTPLKQGDHYFDHVLNAVLSADGTVNSFNCHEFTMVWPSYTALDLPDGSIQRLVPCKYDMWTGELEYFDTINNHMVRINLSTGTKATITSATFLSSSGWGAPKSGPSGWSTSNSSSQQNMGWSHPEPTKEEPKSKDPFKKGAVLFHKPTRTKWTYDCVDSLTQNYVLRSFHDKTQATQFFDKDLNDFEELFF